MGKSGRRGWKEGVGGGLEINDLTVRRHGVLLSCQT